MNLFHNFMILSLCKKKKKKISYHITNINFTITYNIENIKKLLKNHSELERNEDKTRNKKKKKFEISLCIASQIFLYKLYSFPRRIVYIQIDHTTDLLPRYRRLAKV